MLLSFFITKWAEVLCLRRVRPSDGISYRRGKCFKQLRKYFKPGVSVEEAAALTLNIFAVGRLAYINPAPCSREANLKALLPNKFASSTKTMMSLLAILIILL
jgi:hypothetical protein